MHNKIKISRDSFARLILIQCSILLASCTSTEEAAPQSQSTGQSVSQKASQQVSQPLSQLLSQQQDKKSSVLMLKFQEGEPGVEPYVTRMLVANDFLRMDDGDDRDDFTLFDRKKKNIYSVTHENKSILVIPDYPITGSLIEELKLEEKSTVDEKAPLVSGKRPREIELFANGTLCKRMVVVPELHERVIKALNEFRQVLASEHMRNLGKTPAEMQDPCFLGYEVHSPEKVFQFGFPIQEQDYSGKTRILLDYNSGFSINPSVFQLPQGYREFMSSDMQ